MFSLGWPKFIPIQIQLSIFDDRSSHPSVIFSFSGKRFSIFLPVLTRAPALKLTWAKSNYYLELMTQLTIFRSDIFFLLMIFGNYLNN